MAETPKTAEQIPEVVTSSVGADYASFWSRLAAAVIDSILIALVMSLFTGTFNISGEGMNATVTGTLPAFVSVLYYVMMTANYGATLGKMALKIKVVSEETGENLTYGGAILREFVGKFVSSAVLGLGYFWMLWDDKKQTWHDKIGRSLVVKAN